MYLSRSGGTYVLKCHCGHYNLSFCDHGLELAGTVSCLMCGAEAQWQELLADCAPSGALETDAEIHVLKA